VTGAPGTVTVTRLDGNGTWLVALEGEHDAFTVPQVQQRTREVWATCTLAIVDLTAATFIDAAVLGWLLRARAATETRGPAAFAIVERPDCFAGYVFGITQLRDDLPCYPSRAAAKLGSWEGILAPSPAAGAFLTP
jgi:anti-anti-sigma regulatory factor